MRTKTLFLTIGAMTSLVALSACARSPEPTPASPSAVATGTTSGAEEVATGAVTPGTNTPTVDASLPLVVVHKNESCGCCVLWVDHMRAAGFPVEVRNADNLDPVKTRVGVPTGKGSCHTAEVGGYFVEGHVPAEDVKRLLVEKPAAKGLVLPGMPLGSPGMEVPDGTVQPYTVELVEQQGTTTVFAQH